MARPAKGVAIHVWLSPDGPDAVQASGSLQRQEGAPSALLEVRAFRSQSTPMTLHPVAVQPNEYDANRGTHINVEVGKLKRPRFKFQDNRENVQSVLRQFFSCQAIVMVENKLWREFPEELKVWLASEESKPAADSIVEMVREARRWIESGAIKVERENNQYFSLIESKYPVCVNRIEWSWVQNRHSGDVLPNEVSDAGATGDEHASLAVWRNTIDGWLRSCGVGHADEVILVGDGGNAAFRMSVASLLECYPLLFSLPQHTYVLPANAEWCLNYTMEGQLFFGKAADALRRGVVKRGKPDELKIW